MDELAPKPLWKSLLGWLTRLVILAALAGAAWWGWTKWQAGQTKGPEYATEAALKAPFIVEKTTATGTLQALVTVQVGAQVSGRVINITKDYNSIVKEGELLAELDPTLYKSQLEQGRANLLSAQAGLQRSEAAQRAAQRTLKRTRQLFDKQLATQAEYDQAVAQAELADADIVSAKAQVAQAQAAVRLQEANLTYTKIYSPVDGVVLSRNVDVGQTVASAMQAPVLFQIAKDLSQMQAHAAIDEADIGKLREQMPATFTVDAFRGETFRGQVAQLRLSPQTVQNVVTYDAVVDVANPGARLRPGMTASVTLETAFRKDVLAVPNAALRWRPGTDDKIEGLPAAATSTEANAGPSPERRERWRQRKAEGGAGLPSNGTNTTIPAKPMTTKVYALRGKQVVAIEVVTGISDGRVTEIVSVVSGQLEAGDQLVVRRTDKIPSASAGGASGIRGGGMGGGAPRRLF